MGALRAPATEPDLRQATPTYHARKLSRRLQIASRRLFFACFLITFLQYIFQDAPRRLQDGPRGLPNRPRRAKMVFLSQHGPMLAPTWSHVGTKIAFRRYLMLKQPES